MKLQTTILSFLLSSFVLAQTPSNQLAPYVPSPQDIIDRMLEVSQLKRGEMVYDIGCGDGRILVTAVQKFGAKAVGIEISPKLAQSATDILNKLGLRNRAQVLKADAMTVDLSPADVVTLYLTTSANETLRPKLEQSLKPGTRVVSHDYPVKGWKPQMTEEVFAHNRMHKIYLYVVEKN